MTILDRIIATKREELERDTASRPLSEVVRAAGAAEAPRNFRRALASDGGRVSIISEVKKASPSKGVIRENFDPVDIAQAYERGGASAISVLTDREYFQGSLEYLRDIRKCVTIPLLRKDFIVDEYQIYEARAAGADAILLILAALDVERLAELGSLACDLGMDVLWEVHDREELERLLPLEPSIIGINNRDLRTFEVRLETTRDLVPLIPEGTLCVSESGFFKAEEIRRLADWGAGAFLIGESLMRAPDPGEELRRLMAEV